MRGTDDRNQRNRQNRLQIKMEDCDIVGKDKLESRVIVEGKTLMDRVEIPEKEQKYLKRIGVEILEWGALLFKPIDEDYKKAYGGAEPDHRSVDQWDEMMCNLYPILQEKPIKVFYLLKRDSENRIGNRPKKKVVHISPYNNEDCIEGIYCNTFPDKVKHLTCSRREVKFHYKDAIIKLHYSNELEALRGLATPKKLREIFGDD